MTLHNRQNKVGLDAGCVLGARELTVDVSRLITFRTEQPISGFAFLARLLTRNGREAGASEAVRSRAGALERVSMN